MTLNGQTSEVLTSGSGRCLVEEPVCLTAELTGQCGLLLVQTTLWLQGASVADVSPEEQRKPCHLLSVLKK